MSHATPAKSDTSAKENLADFETLLEDLHRANVKLLLDVHDAFENTSSEMPVYFEDCLPCSAALRANIQNLVLDISETIPVNFKTAELLEYDFLETLKLQFKNNHPMQTFGSVFIRFICQNLNASKSYSVMCSAHLSSGRFFPLSPT